MRLLENEFMETLNEAEKDDDICRTVTLATGVSASSLLTRLSKKFMEKFPNITVQVVVIENHFFGTRITVSGLLTGQDLLAQLKDRELGDKLLLPCNLLRSGEEVFLDDMTLTELKNALQVKIDIVKSSGQDLLDAILKE